MIGSLVGSFGFLTTFSVTFARIVTPPVGPEVKVPLPLPTPVDRRFFGCDAQIAMTAAATADTFDLTIIGFDPAVLALLKTGSTLVTINLGYSDGGTADVMVGLLLESSLAPVDGYYEARLKGTDFAFSRLRDPRKRIRKTYTSQTVGQIATAICGDVGLSIQADDGPQLGTQAFDDVTPLQALLALAQRGDFVLQTKNGGVYLGAPASIGSTDFVPIDDDGSGTAASVRGDGADGPSLATTDYIVAGRPKLRPGDSVTIGTDPYRLDTVTHDLKRNGSYVCRGRAISAAATRDDAAAASRPDGPSSAEYLRRALYAREQRRPAVTAGVIATYNDGHTGDVSAGVAKTPEMITPTTSAPLRSDPVTLAAKPIGSSFAFDHCGFIAPVYPGMRALLAHGWHEPDDAVIAGFVWDDTMTKPANQPGDWWLCLPTGLDGNGKPTGNGVDDLIDATGKRVIAVSGLKIAIGAGLLNNVGTRPTPGDDDTLVIQSDQGPTITISGSTISFTDGTSANVQISNGTVALTDGSIALKIANGKVAIG